MRDLTPRWNRIREDHPEAHEALVWAVAKIFEAKNTSVPLPDPPVVDLTPAVERGVLVVEHENLSFTEPDVLSEYLIRYATEEVALPAWGDLERFARAFDDIQHRSTHLKMRQETANGVLLVLAHEHGKDLLGRVAEAAGWAKLDDARSGPFWSIYPSFCKVLPQLDLSPTALARGLEPVLQASEGDLSGGLVFSAVEKLAQCSQALAESLLDAFIARPDSPVIALASSALVALATFNLKAAHEKALLLLDEEKPSIRRVGAGSLGRFDYSADTDGTLLRTTLERLEQLRATPDTEMDYVLVRAYGDILDHAEEEALRALVEMATCSDPAVQFQMSFVLFRKADEAYDKPWFHEALLHLAHVSSSHTGTLKYLDYSAARCVRDFPEVALSFIERLIITRDYGSEGRDYLLPDLLSNTFAALREHQAEALANAVTRWFASQEPRFHRAARDIVQHHAYAPPNKSQPTIALSKTVLEDLDEQTVIHMLTRIFGYVGNSQTLAALLISALRRDPCPESLVAFVTEALSEYVLYNYPGEAGDYLRHTLEDAETDSESIKRKVIRAALSRSDAYLEARRQLPVAKELQPSSHHVYLLRIAQQKQNSSLMEETNKQTPLLSLIRKVPLKYGRMFFTEVEGTFTAPSPLTPFSTQWEHPRGELIDPLGQAHQRMLWQQAGLSEPDDDVQNDDGEASNA